MAPQLKLLQYETKIEKSVKAGSHRELNPGHLWLEPPRQSPTLTILCMYCTVRLCTTDPCIELPVGSMHLETTGGTRCYWRYIRLGVDGKINRVLMAHTEWLPGVRLRHSVPPTVS